MTAPPSPHGWWARRRLWLDLTFVLFLAVVAFGVFGPDPGAPVNRAGAGARRAAAELRSAVPGGGARAGSTPASNGDLVLGLSSEDVGNVAMFVPFGVLFPARWPRRRWWTIPAGVALSASIELIQGLFLSWRTASLVDLRWNSLGAVLGFSLWLAGRAVVLRRHRTVAA